jgi:hypothetical protein
MNRDYWQLKAAAANYTDATRTTTRITNRLKALQREGLFDPSLQAQLERAEDGRNESARILKKLYRQCAPPAIVKFQGETQGLGDLLMAQLIGICGDLVSYTEAWWEANDEAFSQHDPDSQDDREKKPEKRVLVTGAVLQLGVRELWQYCGHGDASARRRRGASQEDQFAAGHPVAKTVAHEMAVRALYKTGKPDKNGRVSEATPYYPWYLKWKEQATLSHPDWKPLRCHNHAIRRVAKAILKDLWRVQHGWPPVYGEQTPWHPQRESDAASRRQTARMPPRAATLDQPAKVSERVNA